MYFGNINDTDFNERHGTIKDNIKISLTNLLSNDLFKVETITMATKTYYKIIPLFYYEEVTCTDKEAEIMDRLIICQNKADTVFQFTSPHLHLKYKIYSSYVQGTNEQYYYHIRILDEWARPVPDIQCRITSETPTETVTTITTYELAQIDTATNKGDFTSKYSNNPSYQIQTSNKNGLLVYVSDETQFTLTTNIDGNNYIITTEVNE